MLRTKIITISTTHETSMHTIFYKNWKA